MIFKLVSQHIKDRLTGQPPSAPVPSAPVLASPPPSAPVLAAPASSNPNPSALPELLHEDEPLLTRAEGRLAEGDRELVPPIRPATATVPSERAPSPVVVAAPTGPRVRRRRDFPLLPVLTLLMVAALVLLLVRWRDLFLPAALPKTPPAAAKVGAQPAPAVVPPPPTVAEVALSPAAVGDAGRSSPIPTDRATEDPPDPAATDAAVTIPEFPPAGSPPAPTPPSNAASESAAAEPALTPPTTSFERIVDIGWTPLKQRGIKITISADGPIPEGRYKHFRLDQTPPREVIRLLGVKERFSRASLTVDEPGVAQIRTGYHARPEGNELHVVIDLTDPRYQIGAITLRGSRLEVEIKP